MAEVFRISSGGDACIHTYFDICPESPDGTRIVYSRFTGGRAGLRWSQPASGEVVVCDVDGRNEVTVGEFDAAIGHTGPHAQWINDDQVMFETEEQVEVVTLSSGARTRFPGACGMFHPGHGSVFVADASGVRDVAARLNPAAGISEPGL